MNLGRLVAVKLHSPMQVVRADLSVAHSPPAPASKELTPTKSCRFRTWWDGCSSTHAVLHSPQMVVCVRTFMVSACRLLFEACTGVFFLFSRLHRHSLQTELPVQHRQYFSRITSSNRMQGARLSEWHLRCYLLPLFTILSSAHVAQLSAPKVDGCLSAPIC